jgi:hypothetical protein
MFFGKKGKDLRFNAVIAISNPGALKQPELRRKSRDEPPMSSYFEGRIFKGQMCFIFIEGSRKLRLIFVDVETHK